MVVAGVEQCILLEPMCLYRNVVGGDTKAEGIARREAGRVERDLHCFNLPGLCTAA